MYRYANSLYEQETPALLGCTLAAYEDYLRLAPEGKYADDAVFRTGKLYERNRKPEQALLFYMKVLYLYPESARQAEARDGVLGLLSRVKALKDRKGPVEEALGAASAGLAPQERRKAFVEFLRKLDLAELYPPMLREFREYLLLEPEREGNDRLQKAIALLHERLREYPEAVAALEKIRFLYPESPLIPVAMIEAGGVYQYQMKDAYLAKKSYNQVLLDFPDDVENAGNALFRLAEVEEKMLDRPSQAVTHLTDLADRYPGNPNVTAAIFDKARILEDAFRDRDGAARTLLLVPERFPDDPRAAEAMAKAGEIQEKGSLAEAVRTYEDLALKYPKYAPLPEILYDAGRLAEKELSAETAARLYRKVVNGYPDSLYAQRSRKRLESLAK